MKTDDLLMMMAAAVGVFLIANASKAKAGTASTGVKTTGTPINAANNGQGFGNVITRWNGWTYYDSGYGTDQFGSIYYQGEKVADGTWGAV